MDTTHRAGHPLARILYAVMAAWIAFGGHHLGHHFMYYVAALFAFAALSRRQ